MDAQYLRDLSNTIDGWTQGAKQMLQTIALKLAQEEKEKNEQLKKEGKENADIRNS